MATVKLPPLTDERLAEIGQNATDLGSLALELVERRKAMAYADSLGIDVDAVARLICPPPCERCRGQGPVVMGGKPFPCSDCHGRSQHTLHDRLDEVHRVLDHAHSESDRDIDAALDELAAIVADLAKPGVTP